MELLGKVKEIAGPLVESVLNFKEKRQTLKRKLLELESIEADINYELQMEESVANKKRKNEVKNWLFNVENIKSEIHRVEESSWNGLLGDSIDNMTREVVELIDKGRFERGIVVDVSVTDEEALLTTKLVGQRFREYKSKVWECLMEDGSRCIGIYGMGGAGKTTLVTHIYNDLLEKNSYHVYWVTVSQDLSIYKLQNLIAKTIHLDISNDDDEKKRAAKLSRALNLKQKFVLVLDDLWIHFPLEKIGVPIRDNGCKLILTTRSLDVCWRMGCQESIKVEPLSEEEGWNLFEEKIQQPLHSKVEEIAKSIAKECAGLPLGIVTMAGSMRGVEDVCEWRYALTELQESKAKQTDMESDVFQILKSSYNRLTDSVLQQCFLYCALYLEDHQIDRKELIECLIDERVIEASSRRAGFDKGYTMLNRLERVFLLERVMEAGRRCVRMHDLIRDMAIQIMEMDSRVIIKARIQSLEMPYWGSWSEDLVRISLMKNQIVEIPFGYSPKCPNLSTILLCGNEQLRLIPDSFFEQLHGLKVLDLSGTSIGKLPDSVSNLVNLNALRLRFCVNLMHVPSLAKLRALRKLDLKNSGIEELPRGMEMLSNLRFLNLYGTRLKELPPGMLPKLSNLQVLVLDPGVIAKVEEVESLKNLETSICRFHSVGDLTYSFPTLDRVS